MQERQLILETERLCLECFHLGHADFVLRLLNSPDYIRFIGDKGIKTLAQAQQYIIDSPMAAFEQYGFGFSVVSLKQTAEPIGGCGLITREGREHVDIGFGFLPGYMGHGYAYEIASATMTYAKEVLRLPKVQGITIPENERSIKLLKKLGLVFEGMTFLPNDEEELMLFGIDLLD